MNPAIKSHSASILAMVQIAVGVVILAMVLRTWLVMGLIEPVSVAGSSMVPTLLGPHVAVQCERCRHPFNVGGEFAEETSQAACPQCGYSKTSLIQLPVLRGDRLVIDRTAFAFRFPQRWEPVVFSSPADAGNLVVKRVVGLPGETIQLRKGEIWINGRITKKSFSTQRALRHLVHLETSAAQRWQGDGWTRNDEAWKCESQDDWQWLSYVPPEENPITDDLAYNAGLTRRLFAVRDLCLATRLRVLGDGLFGTRINDGEQVWEIHLWPTSGKLELRSGGTLLSSKKLSPESTLALQAGEVLLEISSIDQQLLVAIDGRLEFTYRRGVANKLTGRRNSRPLFSVGARTLTLNLLDLRIYRDAYFASREESLNLDGPMVPITLGEREIYVLGDNVPVSLDSRQWGPLPLRFLVGKPLGVR